MIERFIHNRQTRLLFAALTIVSGALGYYYFAQSGSYREIIVLFAAAIGGVILFGGELGVRFGFVLWVLTLALGYRTIAWTSNLAFHPAEILLWLLLACILVQRRLVSKARLGFPVWLWLLIPFGVLAWWPMIAGGVPWDKMLNECRNFILFIPLMIVASVVLEREAYWRYILLAFFATGSCIALLGIIEYWFPEVASLFPAFMADAKPTITQEGFIRATFSFWGGPMGTFVCVMALPAALVLAMWWRRWSHRLLIGAGSILQILAIYIGGYRSIWFILIIQVLITCLLRLKRQGAMVAIMCLVFLVGGYELVPRTSERLMSGVAVLKGHPTDSSGWNRTNRALGALSRTFESPYGSGWSSAGWVHSDFLQVAVNLGLIGGLIFLGGYLSTLLRMGRRLVPYLRRYEQGDLGLSLFLSMIAAGGILTMEGATVLPQMTLPVWLVWVLAEIWLRQTAEVRELAAARSFAYQFVPVRMPDGLESDA
jgi:hypothetical protein